MAAPAIDVAGDVAAAGGALAGLILVYLASVAASISDVPSDQQHFVITSYRLRAWFAFAGLALCLVSVGVALLGKRFESVCAVNVALGVLMLALVWVLISGLLTVLEIG